jgi:hypothetical protein
MPLIEVQRVSDGYSKGLTLFDVAIDGRVVGALGRGESETFEVAPGPHEVFASIYWCRSEKLDVDLGVGQKLTLRCETRATNFFSDGYWASFGRRRYLRLTEVASEGSGTGPGPASAGESVSPPPPVRRRRASPPKPGGADASRTTTNRLRRQPYLPALLVVLAILLLFAFSRGLGFLAGISVSFIAVQAVIAINFHLLEARSTPGPAIKSHEPFRFRIAEEAIISTVFGMAGLASLTGLLHAGKLAGWLALAAACAGLANILATRRGNTAGIPGR